MTIFRLRYNYLEIWNLRVQKKHNTEKIKMTFCYKNYKNYILIYLPSEIYKISSWKMIFTWYSNDFWQKIKMYNSDPFNVLFAIATNIPQRLKTVFLVQGHIL